MELELRLTWSGSAICSFHHHAEKIATNWSGGVGDGPLEVVMLIF